MAATMRPGLASLPLIYPEVEVTLPVCIGQRTIPLGHELTVAPPHAWILALSLSSQTKSRFVARTTAMLRQRSTVGLGRRRVAREMRLSSLASSSLYQTWGLAGSPGACGTVLCHDEDKT